jgi:hypothetical protein
MPKLAIEVEAPASFCDIDFNRMAEHFGGPVDVITDLEGTAIAWGYRPGHAVVSPDVVTTLSDANDAEVILGAHAMTNRAGAGGRALTTLFQQVVKTIDATLSSFGEYPQSRMERKPSGMMSERLIESIHWESSLQGVRRQSGTRPTIAFVGDKLSDMREASMLHEKTGIAVVGFMVERYGNTDHPLDTVFGKRRKATASREDLKKISQNRFIR